MSLSWLATRKLNAFKLDAIRFSFDPGVLKGLACLSVNDRGPRGDLSPH